MSSEASPLQKWETLLTTSTTHDKLLRLLQYVLKLLRGLRLGHAQPGINTVLSKLHALESTVSSTRQTTRLFKWISHYSKTSSRADASDARHKPSITRWTRGVMDIAMVAYYVCDNAALLTRIGVLSGSHVRATRRAARFWFIAAAAGLLVGLLAAEQRRSRDGQLARHDVATCVSKVCDMAVAGSIAGNVGHPGLVGACGAVSSACGLWLAWPCSTRG